jgi:hypothetical protein
MTRVSQCPISLYAEHPMYTSMQAYIELSAKACLTCRLLGLLAHPGASLRLIEWMGGTAEILVFITMTFCPAKTRHHKGLSL